MQENIVNLVKGIFSCSAKKTCESSTLLAENVVEYFFQRCLLNPSYAVKDYEKVSNSHCLAGASYVGVIVATVIVSTTVVRPFLELSPEFITVATTAYMGHQLFKNNNQ